tara:strand:+ start:74 stop:256 length:183 start_codon:yes stop_codon:yes gene_type:complete
MKDISSRFQTILEKYKEIESKLSTQSDLDRTTLVKLNKDYAEMTPLVEKISNYSNLKKKY